MVLVLCPACVRLSARNGLVSEVEFLELVPKKWQGPMRLHFPYYSKIILSLLKYVYKFFERVCHRLFWTLLGYTVTRARASPRNLTRLFLLGTRPVMHWILWLSLSLFRFDWFFQTQLASMKLYNRDSCAMKNTVKGGMLVKWRAKWSAGQHVSLLTGKSTSPVGEKPCWAVAECRCVLFLFVHESWEETTADTSCSRGILWCYPETSCNMLSHLFIIVPWPFGILSQSARLAP